MTQPFQQDNPNAPQQGNIPTLVIESAPLAPSDQNAQFNPPQNSVPGEYQISSRYEKDFHRYMMGVTSPGGFNGASVSFVQLAAPTLLWIVDWTVSQVGSPPNIPNPTPLDVSWVFLDEHIEPGILALMPDGVTPVYRISGTYFYGHANPSIELLNNVNFTKDPWTLDTFDRSVPTSLWDSTIINPSPQQSQQPLGLFVNNPQG